MDADGSHQAEQLPELLAALADADLVLGSRWVTGGKVVNWPKSREVLSRGGNLDPDDARHPAAGRDRGFRAFRRETLLGLGLDNVASAGYCFQVDLVWRALKAGFRVVEVPITFIERGVRLLEDEPANCHRGPGPNHPVGRGTPREAIAQTRNEAESSDVMKLRYGWPLVLLGALLVAIPILEVWLLVQVGQQLGLLPTVLILLVEVVVGVLLMRHEGACLEGAHRRLYQGQGADRRTCRRCADLGRWCPPDAARLPDRHHRIRVLLRWTRPLARKMIAFFVARRINRLGIR